MKIEMMKVADLIPYENNPRDNDSAVDAVANSIKEFGFLVPIVVDKDNVIAAGHTRLKAANSLGMETVPVIKAKDLTDEQIKAFRLADNKTGELAGWDFDLLPEEIKGIAGIDMTAFGFDQTEIEDPNDTIEDDYDEDAEEIPERVQMGEVWELGEHRLICGDSTDIKVVDRLMDGVKADMVFTDPPYGMKKENEGVLNDNLNFDDLLDFNRQWIPLTFGALKDNGSWYCWGIDEPLMDIYSNILKPMQKENKITFRNLLTWDKGDAGAGGVSFMGKDGLRSYPVGSEKCLFVMCGEQDMRFKRNLEEFNEMFEPIRKWFEDERKKSGLSVEQISKIDSTRCSHYWAKVQFEFPTKEAFCKIQTYCVNNGINAFGVEYEEIKKEYEEIKKEYDGLKKKYYSARAYFDNTHDTMTDVWAMGRISHEEKMQAGGHATPKPIALCSRAIKSSSREGEIVLDIFGGSGSTLIACEQLNRKCYMAEISPEYCDVIIDRWEKFTGKKARKIEER